MGPRRHGVRPSVDTTLETAAQSFGPAILTSILTGMGEDGTEGARAIKAAGGLVLAEDESTCVVYGMHAQWWSTACLTRLFHSIRWRRRLPGTFRRCDRASR